MRFLAEGQLWVADGAVGSEVARGGSCSALLAASCCHHGSPVTSRAPWRQRALISVARVFLQNRNAFLETPVFLTYLLG